MIDGYICGGRKERKRERPIERRKERKKERKKEREREREKEKKKGFCSKQKKTSRKLQRLVQVN